MISSVLNYLHFIIGIAGKIGAAACLVDTGSPIVCHPPGSSPESNKYVQAGIESFSKILNLILFTTMRI